MSGPVSFLIWGYFFTILVEGPVLWWGLHPKYTTNERLFSILWLTACTYPIVILVLPQLISVTDHRNWYLLVAETFAPAAECLLFYHVFSLNGKQIHKRDLITIVIANLMSFAAGEIVRVFV